MKHLLILFLFVSCLGLQLNAQLFSKDKAADIKIQKYRKCYEYWDEDSTIVSTKGHYCNNIPCKTWKYYHSNGILRLKVKYADRIKIKYYTRGRRLEQKGYAVLDKSSGDVHFYWHGIWKFYDDRRKCYRVSRFEKGEEVEILSGPAEAIYFD